ncbi:hypothetical protein J7E97_10280 [Streptomyces sp. ISL-66]|uniref:hypothetical protein n=1 Tax=Streptomyces sp. ISL-66 TaxID=2819186 RepID=UPI001BE79F29|nr:hypothetical protein [Streptomyces sp. ISL-66]MBT2468253.1 hypothetical protein [Streptomyces sp. ISL-66]
MITEPEFDGSWSGPPERPLGAQRPDPAEPPDPSATPVTSAGSAAYGDARGPGRRPWRWALAGALLASVLWAGAWWTVAPRDDRPPMRYALPLSLCDEAKLPVLARLAEVGGWEYTPRLHEHPAVDQALCMLRKPPPGSEEPVPAPSLSYEVQVSVALHKRTDPDPEFGADPGAVGWIGTVMRSPRSVPGLGERALISEAEYGRWWRLSVLDGGAVFALDVMVWRGGADDATDGRATAGTGPGADPPEPDSDAIQAAMIDDMHGLMAKLRR